MNSDDSHGVTAKERVQRAAEALFRLAETICDDPELTVEQKLALVKRLNHAQAELFAERL